MRWTFAVLGRARPRVAARVADLARQDAQRSWSRKTARLLDVALRNLAPLDWKVVQKFAELPPQKSDVEPLLPHLEKWARTKDADPKRIDTVGSLALQLELLPLLSQSFPRIWLASLKKANPFRAIEIWKQLGSQDVKEGILLYLAANQPETAAELVKTIEVIPGDVFRGFVLFYVDANNLEMAQHWINRWQNPLPEDLRWLHHLLRNRNLTNKLNVPLLLDSAYTADPNVKLGEGMQHLVSSANRLIVLEPDLLETEAKHVWATAMSEPSKSTLFAFVAALAKHTKGPFSATQIHLWITILRLCSSETAVQVLGEISPWLPPRAFAVVISRAEAKHIPGVLELIPPEFLYTQECLSALARKSPSCFLELIVPPELLETTLKEHHIVSLWTANPPNEVKSWLLPLTIQHLHSARLLSSAVRSLAVQNDEKSARTLLEEFTGRGYEIDTKLFSKSETKLSKPVKVDLNEQEREAAIEAAMQSFKGHKLNVP